MEEFLKSISLGMLVRSFFAGGFFIASFYVAANGETAFLEALKTPEFKVIAPLAFFLGVFAYAFHRSAIYPWIEAAFDRWPYCCTLIQKTTIEALINRWDRPADGEKVGHERAKHITSWADYAHLQYMTVECIAWGAFAQWAVSGEWGDPSSPLIGIMVLCFLAGLGSDWRLRSVEDDIRRREAKKRGLGVIMEVTCEGCGSIIRIRTFHLPARDRDWLPCPVCHAELERWNGSTGYELVEVVKRKEPPKDSAQ